MWPLHKPPGMEKMMLQKDNLGQVQFIATLGGISAFSPGLQLCFPATWAFPQWGGGSPFQAGERAVRDGGVTACAAALEHAGCWEPVVPLLSGRSCALEQEGPPCLGHKTRGA